MAGLTTDAERARRYLERALAVGSKPDLDSQAIDDLMADAATEVGGETEPVYTSASLNRAASVGWGWKAALTADRYDDIGGGGGKYLRRPEWTAKCLRFAAMYGSGQWDVLEGSKTAVAGTIGSVAVQSSTAAVGRRIVDPYEQL